MLFVISVCICIFGGGSATTVLLDKVLDPRAFFPVYIYKQISRKRDDVIVSLFCFDVSLFTVNDCNCHLATLTLGVIVIQHPWRKNARRTHERRTYQQEGDGPIEPACNNNVNKNLKRDSFEVRRRRIDDTSYLIDKNWALVTVSNMEKNNLPLNDDPRSYTVGQANEIAQPDDDVPRGCAMDHAKEAAQPDDDAHVPYDGFVTFENGLSVNGPREEAKICFNMVTIKVFATSKPTFG